VSKKIAILGKLNTKYYAPFGNPDWEIWTMGKHKDHDLIPRIDKCFDIHKNPTNKDAIMRDEFPIDDCIRLVGGEYFNNTSSWLIAYAILEGATDIALYGMRFEQDHDLRQKQYNNVRELIFFAKGRGINVTSYDEVMLKEYKYADNQDFDTQ
jgi:hypothetical protein